jgi:hypothetical protein
LAIARATLIRRKIQTGRSPYVGLVPRRWKSGEIGYTGSISKVGDRRLRTLLYEAPNVMLTRYRDDLALKDWALRVHPVETAGLIASSIGIHECRSDGLDAVRDVFFDGIVTGEASYAGDADLFDRSIHRQPRVRVSRREKLAPLALAERFGRRCA